jgi:hypothetical protein
MYRIFIVLLFTATASLAQQSKMEADRLKNIQAKQFWLATGSGLNNHFGLLGISMEYKLPGKWSVFGGIGFGTWGNKLGAGMRIYKQYPVKRAFSFSLTQASGLSDIDLKTNTINPNGIVVDTTVAFNLYPVWQLNASWMRYWRLSDWCRFYIEAGYSFALSQQRTKNFEITTPGYQPSQLTKRVMSAFQPGGITVSLGFSFALD